MLGSLIIYAGGNMDYIDALFFASGSATQSGLNTIDINKLRLYQQVVIMIVACMCTPIFIHTFIVFIRLYWFEKRFQNVIVARNMRRQRTRSQTKSEAKPDSERDLGREESGVGDREIVVLREVDGHVKGQKIDDDVAFNKEDNESGSSSSNSQNGAVKAEEAPLEKPNTEQPFQRDVMFADEVASPAEHPERLPQRNKDISIAFVENQRNPKDTATFRIPGPRDYDRGLVPEMVDQEQDQASHDDDHLRAKRERSRSLSMPAVEVSSDDHNLKNHITIDVPDRRGRPTAGASAYHMRRRGSDADSTNPPANTLRQRARSRTFGSFLSREKGEEDPMPYLSWTPTVGRNSAFVDLTEEQREELGGIEYRALKLLLWILVAYFVGFHLFGMVTLLPWIVRDSHYSSVVTDIGESPVWWGFFTPASMFNDLGFTLTPDSMISFQRAVLPLLIGTFLIVIGNTGFPCMLRFVIWLVSKCVPYRSAVWEELCFLLDHPRRCFTLLFPSNANWWLFAVLVLLNGIDLIFFVLLDLHDETVSTLPGGFQFLDGLYQAASTRTAGFAVVDLSSLHPAIQVSYLIMMYISVFPIAISLRKTNVYEEKSLGIYGADEEGESSYISTHLRRQLSFDLWFVFLGFFLISIIEGRRLGNSNDLPFTLFSVLFEIVSAYGTVGLSLGYPGVNTSFSGQFKPLSKLIIIAMQIRGRHRGLPYALDRAILLPSESLHKKEEEDATRRVRKSSTAVEGHGPLLGVQADGSTTLVRTGTARSGNSTLSSGEGFRGRFRVRDVGRFMSGALSAGPTIPREKKA
ncbi:hypothetical protein P280DRAFT_387556 [Massarina eburnea CBS 473.64]|uniref:Potassium transport protein n=1 Tax=Massarina eburnea CBS 473.64 TaxID=1395130 RepID=A0A6A6SGB5_9PLEO|nr:hypothetical protein P280DRAFT_387556 [Massarina eburnea CBS 473.64]